MCSLDISKNKMYSICNEDDNRGFHLLDASDTPLKLRSMITNRKDRDGYLTFAEYKYYYEFYEPYPFDNYYGKLQYREGYDTESNIYRDTKDYMPIDFYDDWVLRNIEPCKLMFNDLQVYHSPSYADDYGNQINGTLNIEFVRQYSLPDDAYEGVYACEVVNLTFFQQLCDYPIYRFDASFPCTPVQTRSIQFQKVLIIAALLIVPILVAGVRLIRQFLEKYAQFMNLKPSAKKKAWNGKIPYISALCDIIALSLSAILTRLSLPVTVNIVFIIFSVICFMDLHTILSGVGCIISMLANIGLGFYFLSLGYRSAEAWIFLILVVIEFAVLIVYFFKLKFGSIKKIALFIDITSLIIACASSKIVLLFILAGIGSIIGVSTLTQIANGKNKSFNILSFFYSHLVLTFLVALAAFIPVVLDNIDASLITFGSYFIRMFPLFNIAAALANQITLKTNFPFTDISSKSREEISIWKSWRRLNKGNDEFEKRNIQEEDDDEDIYKRRHYPNSHQVTSLKSHNMHVSQHPQKFSHHNQDRMIHMNQIRYSPSPHQNFPQYPPNGLDIMAHPLPGYRSQMVIGTMNVMQITNIQQQQQQYLPGLNQSYQLQSVPIDSGYNSPYQHYYG